MSLHHQILILKPGHEVHVKNRHHAIFRSAILKPPDGKPGDIVEVHSGTKEFLCYATWNPKAYICARAIAFRAGDPLAELRLNIERAIGMRKGFFVNEDTTAYRLINAEGDAIPGLIVDLYGDILVVQFTTLGMDRLREWVCEILNAMLKPKGIYEKSTGTARKTEGLELCEEWIGKKNEEQFTVHERGLKFAINLTTSQKTGLFLDQREMRSLVQKYAKDRTVLDCCSYVGGFSLAALKGGARYADAVDYDSEALESAKENMKINDIDPQKFQSFRSDAFDFLRKRPLGHPYDFIILDPPAFAKRSTDLEPAKRAYTDLNRLAMQALPPGSLLLTCSCSYQMNPELFQTIIFHAARQANRSVKILQRHRQAVDHPVNIYHPETDYLKSLLLWVE